MDDDKPHLGTFHALGALPFGSAYGSGASQMASSSSNTRSPAQDQYSFPNGGGYATGMEALSEAASAARGLGEFGLLPMAESSGSNHVGRNMEASTNTSPNMGLGMGGGSVNSTPSSSKRSHTQMSSGGGAGGGWAAEFQKRMEITSAVEGTRISEIDLEVAMLHTHLDDIVGLLSPFAASPGNPAAAPLPPYLSSRFVYLSNLIHRSLLSLAPQVHPKLSALFTTPPPYLSPNQPTDQSSAEEQMEKIRKRRDALIARAQSQQNRSQQLGTAAQSNGSISANQTPVLGNENDQVGHSYLVGTADPFDGNGIRDDPVSFFDSISPSNSTRQEYSSRPTSSHTDPYHSIPLKNLNPMTSTSTDPFGFLSRPSSAIQSSYHVKPGSSSGLPVLQNRNSAQLGRCHGCGVVVTLEWRRGPDGPKSLCDSCGLHYAKLASRTESPSTTDLLPTSTVSEVS